MKTAQTILVTGINGFVGPHLARELHKQGHEVIGLGYGEKPNPEAKAYLKSYYGCNLTDQDEVMNLELGPIDSVIHLAGLSSPSLSFEAPHEFISDNSAMLIYLFEYFLKQKGSALPRFVVISSSTIYDPDQPMPLTEAAKIASTSPYAVSKLLNENLCSYYRKRGFEYVIARPFNHTGPGQLPGFIIPDFTMNTLKAGPTGVVPVGTLTLRRDYSDVRDVVRAYAALATADTLPHDIYNIASGQSHTGEEIFSYIRQAAFGDSATTATKTDPAKVRPYEAPDVSVDISRMATDFGWKPEISLEQTITDYVAWAKEQDFTK